MQKALPLLNDGASVILTASTDADNGQEAFGTYAASKAAIRSFAPTWSNELKGRGIRVNAVSPGGVETPGLTDIFGGGEALAAVKDHVAATVAKGRIGRPEEVAATVAFLASEQSSYTSAPTSTSTADRTRSEQHATDHPGAPGARTGTPERPHP